MDDNKRLFEWLNPDQCYHVFEQVQGVTHKCRCGQYANLHTMTLFTYPDYSTESGFFALLAGLRAKGFTWNFSGGDGQNVDVRLFGDDDPANRQIAHADTLPLALFLTAQKAMESEQPTGEGD